MYTYDIYIYVYDIYNDIYIHEFSSCVESDERIKRILKYY